MGQAPATVKHYKIKWILTACADFRPLDHNLLKTA